MLGAENGEGVRLGLDAGNKIGLVEAGGHGDAGVGEDALEVGDLELFEGEVVHV